MMNQWFPNSPAMRFAQPERIQNRFIGRFAFLYLWGLLVFSSLYAQSCSIPVFRYALERWPADPYQIHVFHDGTLTGEQRLILDWLEDSSESSGLAPRYFLEETDVTGDLDDGVASLWAAQHAEAMPWMVVRSPHQAGNAGGVWSGAFTKENAQRIIDSPARKEIAARLLDGYSAVWVFVDSGNQAKDDAAFEHLGNFLETMPTELELPVPAGEPIGDGVDGPVIRLEFTTLRIAKNDPEEMFLRNVLLASEPDLASDYADQPMVFPIFGQGRVLYALVGEGITEDNVREACAFIIGPCSCQVKELNPGTDLLMAVDWDSSIENRFELDLEIPPLVGLPELSETSSGESQLSLESDQNDSPVSASVLTTTVTESQGNENGSVSVSTGGNALLRNLLIALGVLIAGSVVFAVKMFR